MSITLSGADSYFATSTRAVEWGRFSESARTAALADARRVLGRALGRAMDDAESAYAEGDRTRDEFAVYEQALAMLKNQNATANNGMSPYPEAVGDAEPQGPEQPVAGGVYAAALPWLGIPQVATVRAS